VTNPDDGLKFSVVSSSSGEIELGIDINSLLRFHLHSQHRIHDTPYHSATVPGFSPIIKFLTHVYTSSKSTVALTPGAAPLGTGRKTLVVELPAKPASQCPARRRIGPMRRTARLSPNQSKASFSSVPIRITIRWYTPVRSNCRLYRHIQAARMPPIGNIRLDDIRAAWDVSIPDGSLIEPAYAPNRYPYRY